MSIETMGTGLKTRLETISELKRVFAPKGLPKSLNSFPCALILLGDTTYHEAFDGTFTVIFRVIIVVTGQDQPTALNLLSDYIETSGDDSVYAAVEGDSTLGGASSDLRMVGNSGMGTTIWGGRPYLSTEFEIEVIS